MIFSESLKSGRDFRRVYSTGKSVADHNLVMYVRKNDSETNRLGISVSKKVGNSVVRHHLTRLIREVYRLHEEMFRNGLDIVVVVRTRAGNADFHRIQKSFLSLAALQNIIVENNSGE